MIKDNLETPVEWGETRTGFFKKGKIKIVIHYEDGSYLEYWRKNKEDYTISINKRKYLLLAVAIEQGTNPSIHYYFNNPAPIIFKYQSSKISAINMYEKDDIQTMSKGLKHSLATTFLDSSTLHSALTSNLLTKMFSNQGLTLKGWLILMGGTLIIILVVLQLTGVVDVIGMISGGGAT